MTDIARHKVIARRLSEEIPGGGNFNLLDEITTAGYADHNLPLGVTPRQSLMMFRAAFPDTHATVDDVIAESDKAVVRHTVHGTHTGSFFGIPPTGTRIVLTGISIYRFVNGKMAEGWVQYDQLGLIQQIGAIPMPQLA